MNQQNFFLDDNMNAFEILENNKNKLTSRAYNAYYKKLYTQDISEKQYNNIIDELTFVENYDGNNISKKEISAELRFIKKQMKESKPDNIIKVKKQMKKNKPINDNIIKVKKTRSEKQEKPKQMINEKFIPFELGKDFEIEQYNSALYSDVKQKTIDEYNNFYKKSYEFKNNTIETLGDMYKAIQYLLEKKFLVKRRAKKIKPVKSTVSIAFMSDDNENKIRYISVTPDYLQSPDAFINRINAILSGSTQGSDAIYFKDNVKPILNRITLSGTLNIGYNSKKYKPIFKYTQVTDNKCDLCGKIVVTKIFNKIYNTEIPKKYASIDYSQYNNILDLVNFLNNEFKQDNINENICIVANRVEGINSKKNEKYIINGLEYTELYHCKPVIINKGNKGAKSIFIIYDTVAEHFDVCFNSLIIRDDLYMCRNGNILQINQEENGEYKFNKYFTYKEYASGFYTEKIEKRKCLRDDYVEGGVSYIFFDFETVIDWNESSGMKVYSVAYYVCGEDINISESENYNEENRKRLIEQKNYTRVITGLDSLNIFCQDILILQKNRKIKFISFNGSKFDNILLTNQMLKMGNENFQIRNEFYRNNTMINAVVNGRNTFFDIRNHIVGSLYDCCKAFNVPQEYTKTKLDHFEAQKSYDSNKLEQFIKNSNLVEYNRCDVLSLAYIFKEYKNAVYKLCKKDITEFVTASSLAGALNKDHLKHIGYTKKMEKDESGSRKLKIEYEEYINMKKCSVGGRCEVFNNQKVEEKCVSLDVCSLYPFVMMCLKDVYYPCLYSKKYYTEEYIKYSEQCSGFWYCDINQTELRARGYPNFYPKKGITNDYKHEETISNVLISNMQIDFMRSIGIEVITRSGFYWVETIQNVDYFNYLFGFMDEKNRQDKLKCEKSSEYNPAIREFCKGALNSSFGKNLQGLFPEKICILKNFTEYLKIQSDENTKNLTVIDILCDGRILSQYEQKEENLIEQLGNFPIGALILESSRMYMYKYVFMPICNLDSIKSLIYTDTDAIKIREKTANNYIQWINENKINVPICDKISRKYPQWKSHLLYEKNSKIFGSFEDELEDINKSVDSENCYMLCLQPKTWIYVADKKCKFRLKGVNPTDIYLSKNSMLINGDRLNKCFTDKDLYYYVNKNKNEMMIKNNAPAFFNDLYKTGSALVLCTSFRKVIKNTNRNVDITHKNKFKENHHTIEMNVNLKKIKIDTLNVNN